MREKLIELVGQVQDCGCDVTDVVEMNYVENNVLVDHLIAHGVTVQENCKACAEATQNCIVKLQEQIAELRSVQEWIPVSEPPEENGYYLCYVLTSAVGDKVKYEQMPLYWEDDIWLYRHNSYRMCRNVTHWMPLPQPPKGE